MRRLGALGSVAIAFGVLGARAWGLPFDAVMEETVIAPEAPLVVTPKLLLEARESWSLFP